MFIARDKAELEPVPGAGLIVVALQVLTVEEYPAQARLRSLAPATQPHPSRLSSVDEMTMKTTNPRLTSSVPDPDPHVFGPDPDPLVRGMDSAQDPDLLIIEQK